MPLKLKENLNLLWLVSAFANTYGASLAFDNASKAVAIFSIALFFMVNVPLFKSIRALPQEILSTKDIQERLKIVVAGLSNILIFAGVYTSFGVVDTSNQAIIQGDFITGLYFSAITWTTLGYGDLKPVADLRLVAAFEALMGYVYMAILVGVLVDFIRPAAKNAPSYEKL